MSGHRIVNWDLGAGGIYKAAKIAVLHGRCGHSSNGLLGLVLAEPVEAEKEECAILSMIELGYDDRATHCKPVVVLLVDRRSRISVRPEICGEKTVGVEQLV